jgi:hypothetical protein
MIEIAREFKEVPLGYGKKIQNDPKKANPYWMSIFKMVQSGPRVWKQFCQLINEASSIQELDFE